LKKNTEELEVTKKKESSTKVEGKVIDKPLLLEDGRQLLI